MSSEERDATERDYVIVCRPPVRPSVHLSVRDVQVLWSVTDHIRWETSKIISRLISVRFMLGLTPTWAIWCNGNTPKIREEQGMVSSTHILQYLRNGARWEQTEQCYNDGLVGSRNLLSIATKIIT